MERERSRLERGTCSWADMPTELLMNIFSRIPCWSAVSQVCLRWHYAVLSLPRLVILCPVPDCLPPDPLPFPPVAMQLLVPTFTRPRGLVLSRSINEARGPFFRYITMPIPAISSELRLVGGSAGLPLFVDDCYSRLVIRRLTSPQQPGHVDSEIAMSLDLPDGVEGEDVYIGGLAVSRSSSDARCLPLGISVIVVATRSYIFGTRTAAHRQMWSVLPVKEPAEGRNFERQGLRTFVSMLFDGEESAYILDASWRLCFMNWDADGRLQMRELPIQGGENALLVDGVEGLKMVWLLQLPIRDHQGTNLVCLAYRWFDRFQSGRFMAFDLTEGEATRLWVLRPNILGELCVLVNWGPGAVAVVYKRPGVVGLDKGRIYSSLDGLRSYVLGWHYSDMRTVPSYWPVPVWINPEFPNPLCLEDTLVKVIMEDSTDADAENEEPDDAGAENDTSEADAENKEPDDADAINQVEELSASAPMLAGVSSQSDAATTGLQGVTIVPTAAPAPLLERLLRRTLLQLNSGFD